MSFLNISITDDRTAALFAEWMVKKNKTLGQGLLTASRSMCQAFMQFTLPRENQRVENRVESDIHKVYATVGMVFEDIKGKDPQAADAFWYFVSVQQWKRAQQIMQAESPRYGGLSLSPFDGGALHKRLRGPRGHIAKGMTPKMVVRERGQTSKLSTYIAAKRTNVGMAKAGWYEAWKSLGNARGAPEWVTRKRAGKGSFGTSVQRLTGENPSIVIHNQVRHALPSIDDRYKDWIEDAAKGRLIEFFRMQLKSR